MRGVHLDAPDTPAVPALLAHGEPDGAVRCVACAHRCLVRPGRLGICGVRENREGRLVSLVYGRAVAASADPIEKKPLFHAYLCSVAFSIATRGCNMHCRHCQNWEISQAEREGLEIPARSLPPAAVVRNAARAGARSIAYTYVEPSVFVEYVMDTAVLARDVGLANILVTNGYQSPEAIELLAPLVDAANVDLKAFDDAFYRRVCGARLAPVLASIVEMRARGIWLELTTLLIPGLNDSTAELESLARWIVAELGPETPWHVSRFFPSYRMLDRMPTPVATIERAVAIGMDAGLRHVYAGNVPGGGGEDTRCAGCGATLIRRDGYTILASRLRHGRCPDCDRPLAGIGLGDTRVAAAGAVSEPRTGS